MSLATSEILDRSSTTLANALREMVKGEVLDDPFTRSMYSTDASIYEIEPLLVVYPLDELDVKSCLWFGQRHGVPVIARGAGSGLAGESLGKAIVLDFSVHMNKIIELDKIRRQITVQPGVVLDSLNRALAEHGLRFGPDPSSSNRATLGGMIANNASGAHSLKYGDTSQNLIAARVCLMDSTVTLAQPVKLSSPEYESKKKEEGLSGKIHRELPELLKKHAALIASKRPKTERHRSGYALYNVIQGDVYDLAKLLCGSEGTLGVVTQAVLKVELLPAHVSMAVVSFASILDAARAVPAIRETKPFACELFDERLLSLARQAAPEVASLLPVEARTILVIEYEGTNDAEVASQLKSLETLLSGKCQSVRIVQDIREQDRIWSARAAATPLLFRRKDKLQPIPVVEDGAVPVDNLALYLEKAAKIFEKYKLEWEAYAHAGSGLVHIRPMMDLRSKEHLDILEKMAGEIHAAVWECGGTISGEHAEGLVRSQWLEKEAGKELYAVFKEVKALFDPSGLLNPQKKITTDAHLMLKNLRFGSDYHFSSGEKPKISSIDATQAANFRMFKSQLAVRTENTVERQASNPHELHSLGVSPLQWSGSELADEVERCNGCGHCRTTGPEEDMCPRFKYERIEDASPRAKANILRRLMTGRQKQGSFNSDELKEIADTCFNCKLCHAGCPSGVNIPKLVLEAKARYNQSHALTLDQWICTKAEIFFRVGQYVAPLFETLIDLAPFRWLLEKTVGIDRRRPLPRLRRWTLQRRFSPSASSGRMRVVLYPDLFAKFSAPEIAQAAIDVLEHNGIEVEIPDVPWSNMPALTHGAVMEARRQVNKVAGILAPYAFEGLPILTLDSTSCLCLREEFLSYVDSPETRAVSRHTLEIGEFLMQLRAEKKLDTRFQKLDAVFGYHQPCHHKALNIGRPGMELIREIPGVRVMHINQGCCGNSVDFGMITKNYAESMWIGKGLFKELKADRNGIEYGLTESSCCRMQMEHGTGKKTMHPIQILAAAYGYASADAKEEGSEKRDQAEKIAHTEHLAEHDHTVILEREPGRGAEHAAVDSAAHAKQMAHAEHAVEHTSVH